MVESNPNTQQYSPNKKIPNLWRKFRRWLSRLWDKMQPRAQVRKGAAIGIIVAVVILAVGFGIFITPGFPGILDILGGVVILLIIAGLIWLAVAILLKLLSIFPRFIGPIGLIALLVFICVLMQLGFPTQFALLLGLVLGLAQAFLGGGIAALFDKEFKFATWQKKVFVGMAVGIPLALNILLVVWMVDKGSENHLVVLKETPVAVKPLGIANPGLPGSHEILTLTYGSGTDKRRREFNEEVTLKTETVDATPFVKGNKGWRMKLREWYWGFGFEEFPVNGRVWYPEGEGPFPLVLIVHGNHKMQEFSDPGYSYLGELMASRGFIFVSVDENFFNGTFMAGLNGENDGRGWMLLEHLKVWREWNQAEDNLFYNKVDMDNIGLIGHSRGGEAAAIAGSFNRLSHYPDDATVAFDFDFDIKAIISIAPSDGQYKPAGKPTPLENVNYLVFQGAHDSDVSVFMGERQYNRVKFTDGNYWIKSTLYSYRSNHGQFNTVWGDNDWGLPMGLILNRKTLLRGDEQRKISKVYISAFLEYALHGENEYLPIFRDYRYARDWLPEDIYINRLEDSNFITVSDFDEDVDVTTTTIQGGRISGENLTVWREEDLEFRRWGTKQNNAAVVGWGEPEAEELSEKVGVYSILLPQNFRSENPIADDTLLVFTMAEADEKPPEPEDEEKDKKKGNAGEKQEKILDDGEEMPKKGSEDKAKKGKGSDKAKEDKDREPVRLSIELVGIDGTSVKLPLERFMAVPPIMRTKFSKLKSEGTIWGKDYEATIQTFELPLTAFAKENPDFDPSRLKEIRFVFDLMPKGVVILDNLGFTRPRF